MSIYQLGNIAPQIDDSAFVADSANIIGNVTLKANSSVWPTATLRGDNEPIVVGRNSNVQDGAVLHTDPGCKLTIGDNVSVGHQAMLHGCTIGEGSLIGIQAIILNGAVIGKNCLIGAGALVAEGKQIPDNSLVVGTPAKVVRILSDEDVAKIHKNTLHYVERAQAYKTSLIKIG